MGGKRLVYDAEKLKSIILDLDTNGNFSKWSALQEAVANSPYGLEIGISVPNVYNFILKYKLNIKTPRGKKGLTFASGTRTTVRISRGDKWKNNPVAQEVLKDVRQEMEFMCGKSKCDGLLKRFEKGSMKAAIALQCLNCAGGSSAEVRNCEITSCPLYLLRPWQSQRNDDVNAELIIDDVEETVGVNN